MRPGQPGRSDRGACTWTSLERSDEPILPIPLRLHLRRYLLEEMVPELEDLEQRGYFSRAEIKQIVQKRQDFEYGLKRKATLKEDYLRWVGRWAGCGLGRSRSSGLSGWLAICTCVYACVPQG